MGISIIFSLVALSISAKAESTGMSCGAPTADAATIKTANKCVRDAALAMKTFDLCQTTAKLRALKYDLHQDVTGIPANSAGVAQFEQYLRDHGAPPFASAWQLTLYPHPESRELAFNQAVGEALAGPSDGHSYSEASFTPEQLTHLLTTQAFLDSYPASNKAAFEAAEKREVNQAEDIKQASLAEAYVCARYGIANIANCVKSVGRVLEIIDVRGFVLLPVIKEVFTDPRYVEPARKAAAKVYSKIKAGGKPSGDIFSDLKSGFLESGITDPDAENMAWKFLMATQFEGGTSMRFLKPFTTKQTSPILLSVGVISTGQYILDGRLAGDGHLYSYPPTVKIDCDFGKAYDFWVAAYLARQVTQETGNADAASAAAWIAHLGYQMRSVTGGRDPAEPFTRNVYDFTNNGVRLDLSIAAAGAVFGAQKAQGTTKAIDVNAGLRALLKNGDLSLVPFESQEAAGLWKGTGLSGYNRWMNLFSPDSAYWLYKK